MSENDLINNPSPKHLDEIWAVCELYRQ
jgi:hypothetical protein